MLAAWRWPGDLKYEQLDFTFKYFHETANYVRPLECSSCDNIDRSRKLQTLHIVYKLTCRKDSDPFVATGARNHQYGKPITGHVHKSTMTDIL